jgi:FG-GAP-like repeat
MGDNTLSVLLGTGAGSFGAATTFFGVGGHPASVAVGDFNRDGQMDLVVVNGASNSVMLLTNDCGAAQPHATPTTVATPINTVTPTPASSTTGTPTVLAYCTPPPCPTGDVLFCANECPGGCGTQCATPTTSASIATPTQTANGTASCVGDCKGDHHVTVDEILTMVNIALGNGDVSGCGAGDSNHDGKITVDEVLAAVNNALNGCGV